MSQWILYGCDPDGKNPRELASFEGKEAYFEQLNGYVFRSVLAGKAGNVEKVLLTLLKNAIVDRDNARILMRAMRHADEVGLTNDIYDAMECALDEGEVALCWGDLGNLVKHDLTKWEI